MSKLFQLGPDIDSPNEIEPLYLVNRCHPKNDRLDSNVSSIVAPNLNSSDGRPSIFDLPVEIFSCISNYLKPLDLLCILNTCTALRDSATVQQATYRYPFRRCHLGVNHYREYVDTHKSTFERLLKGIDSVTGVYVEKVCLWEWATIKNLRQLIKHCPNLTEIDFSRVVEPIDYTRYRRFDTGCRHGFHGSPMLDIPAEDVEDFQDEATEWSRYLDINDVKKSRIQREMARCHACSDRFQWPLAFKHCPELSQNLTSVRLTYSGARHHEHKNSISGRKQLPKLLTLATRLQVLELDGFEKFAGSRDRVNLEECDRFESAILDNASDNLQVIGLYDMNFVILNISDFLLAMEKFPKLRTLKVSLQSDLDRHRCVASTRANATATPLQYIAALRLASERGWTMMDSGQSSPCKIWPCFSLTQPENIPQLQWLIESPMNWKPVFKWRGYMYNNGWRRAPRMHPHNIEQDYPTIRALFSELRALGVPVRLHLEIPNYEDGFFSWQMDDGSDTRDTPRFLGSSRVGKVMFPWRLDTIGDLVDDLRLTWRWIHVFGREGWWDTPKISTPEEATKTVVQHLARTRESVEKRLKFEAEHIAPFFRKLHHFCPQLTRLALYIPGPLYPDHDSKFIQDILPGEGWTVEHHGTGFADEIPESIDTPINEGDQSDCGYDTDDEVAETDKEINKRRKISFQQLWNKMCEVEKERLPMIHRIFKRVLRPDGSAVPEPLPEGDWYNTPRGANLHCFDVTSIKIKRQFKYLWGDPVAKPEIGNGD